MNNAQLISRDYITTDCRFWQTNAISSVIQTQRNTVKNMFF